MGGWVGEVGWLSWLDWRYGRGLSGSAPHRVERGTAYKLQPINTISNAAPS